MCATVSSTMCLRRADSFAVCTRRWPGSKRAFRRTRAAAMSAGRITTTLRSIVPERSLSSEKAHISIRSALARSPRVSQSGLREPAPRRRSWRDAEYSPAVGCRAAR